MVKEKIRIDISKMILTMVMLCALMTSASLTPLCKQSSISNNSSQQFSNPELVQQIYNSVVVGDYRNAVNQTFILERQGRSDVICSVVNKLLIESKKNILEYAYNIWNKFGEDIVKIYFPIEFRLIFNDDPVLIIDKRNQLPLNLEINTDRDGDRPAFGDSKGTTTHGVSWKIYTIWERNKIYFKIWNILRNQFLKLEIKTDEAGEHKAFGADEEDTWRHEWYFHPFVHDKQVLFYIYNRRYEQALKLGRNVDENGSRPLWGLNGSVVGNPEHFGWHIAPF